MHRPVCLAITAALVLVSGQVALAQPAPSFDQGSQPLTPGSTQETSVSLPQRNSFFRALSLSSGPVNDNPWADSSSAPPPKEKYAGPLFKLSYQYPTLKPSPPVNPPWITALGGKPIGPTNALAYTQALKEQITPNMRALLFDYAHWDAQKSGWYNQPWLANIREPIHGMYEGPSFPASTFSAYGLTKAMNDYVVTFYDSVAAYTVGQLWGTSAKEPKVANGQFQEGAIIVKLAMTTATSKDWAAMRGAAELPLYIPQPPTSYGDGPQQVLSTALMQVDIIVKDSKTAPKSTWVYTTLVYDANASGKDAWDKMVPLGAMWGNDPESTDPTRPLKETVINPAAPRYAQSTLGWNGRLSGPNDGAVTSAYVNGMMIPQAAVSSCMSCHGPAQWPMKDFLLPMPSSVKPGYFTPSPVVLNDTTVVFEPGSKQWMNWFQDRPGNQAQNKGSVALDYDMVFAFKSLPAWASWKAAQAKTLARPEENLEQQRLPPPHSTYNGL